MGGCWRPGRIWILLDPAGRLRSTQAAKGEPGRPASEPPAAATPKGLPGDARVAMGWFAGVRGAVGAAEITRSVIYPKLQLLDSLKKTKLYINIYMYYTVWRSRE